MAMPVPGKFAQLPDEMLSFTILKTAATVGVPRLGRLALQGRRVIETPSHVSITSRGVVPHLSPDNLRSKITLNGVYLALEDCMYVQHILVFQVNTNIH